MTFKSNNNSGSLNHTETDIAMMRRALALAWQGRYSTSPNPRVGCVIAQGNQIVGEGFHQKQGEPHAEVFALQAARDNARGATAYVTLEPCAHYGKTPPCAEALVRAGVARVVAALQDPNPQVAGKGLAILQAANIQTTCGILAEEARAQNRGFLSRFERNRPFIRLKCAISLDGKTALNNGISQWITGSAARQDVQEWRAQSCAILTGIGTVLADNPRLNVRDIPTFRQPIRIVLDTRLQTPLNAHLISDSASPTRLVTQSQDQERIRAYEQYAHVEVWQMPPTADGRIDICALLPLLAQKGIGELWIEGGSVLNGSFLQGNWVDELLIYQAPMILGDQAQSAFRLPEITTLTEAHRWQRVECTHIGEDIRMILRKK